MKARRVRNVISSRRVLLWALDPDTSAALIATVGRSQHFTVVGHAFRRAELEAMARSRRPDLVVCTVQDWLNALSLDSARKAEAGAAATITRLTGREQEVLRLVAQGLTSRQIADSLRISLKTVQTHRAHLREKLEAHDRVDLVKVAICLGLATPEASAARARLQHRSGDR